MVCFILKSIEQALPIKIWTQLVNSCFSFCHQTNASLLIYITFVWYNGQFHVLPSSSFSMLMTKKHKPFFKYIFPHFKTLISFRITDLIALKSHKGCEIVRKVWCIGCLSLWLLYDNSNLTRCNIWFKERNILYNKGCCHHRCVFC